jgi:hypothetical protein
MNTRIPLILLIGSVAASPAWAAAQATATPDAQAQAASLIKGQASAPVIPHNAAGEHDTASHSRWVSAQSQAADLLSSPAKSNSTSRDFNGVIQEDAQAQAQRVLLSQIRRTGKPVNRKELAVSD